MNRPLVQHVGGFTLYQKWTLLKVQHREIHGGRVQTTALFEVEWKTTAGDEPRRLWKVFAFPARFPRRDGALVDEDTYSNGRYAAAAARDGKRI